MKTLYKIGALMCWTSIVAILVFNFTQKDLGVYPSFVGDFKDNIAFSVKGDVPEPTILYTWELQHINGATTTFQIIDFATTTSTGGYYKGQEDIVAARILSYDVYHVWLREDTQIPVISMATVFHELVHQTTQYNYRTCKDTQSRECQEEMAYDAGYIYAQIKSLADDKQLKLKL